MVSEVQMWTSRAHGEGNPGEYDQDEVGDDESCAGDANDCEPWFIGKNTPK